MLGAMLEQATLRLSGSRMVIRFPAGMEAVQRQVEERESLALLRREAERCRGAGVEVRVETGDDRRTGTRAEPPARVRGGGSRKPIPAAEPAASDEKSSGSLLERARNEPGVKRLMDAFGAHVVDVRRHDGPRKPRRGDRKVAPPEDAT
jgi:hypothetical protein